MKRAWFFRNSLSVCSLTSGYGVSARFSFAVFASLAPPRMLTNWKMFVGCG